MVCCRCGCPYSDSASHCPICGLAAPTANPSHPNVTHRGKWLPVVILAVLAILGTILFFLIPLGGSQTTLSAPESSEASGEQSSPLFQRDCFILTDGTLYFDESQYQAYPVLIVPAAIDGQAVTAIGEGCFENISGITTIILPSSITRIGDRAFAGCTDLRGLCISEAVTSIGSQAFAGCGSLEAVYIPTAVSAIGEDAFTDCHAMRYLFYSGFYSDLYHMYPQVISPFTWAICLDGDYRYGAI